VWPLYVWPLRLTRERCEEVDIEKKQRFRMRAASKGKMAKAVMVDDVAKHEKEGRQRRRKGVR
jgi:hypothetical protein